jgi:hypothetical protein
VHLLVDSTGLKLCGSGEWLLEKHGTKTRRSWRKLHLAMDAGTRQIAAAVLATSDVGDASQVGPLLDQINSPVASFTADGAHDQDRVYAEIAARHPEACVIVPLRRNAVPSSTVDTAPTKRDHHLKVIAERGRKAWQKASGYHWRALVEADISRFKRVIGDGLRSRTDRCRTTEMVIAVAALSGRTSAKRGSPSHVGWLSSYTPCFETGRTSHSRNPPRGRRNRTRTPERERRPREGADDGADFGACDRSSIDCSFNQATLHPADPIKCRTSK